MGKIIAITNQKGGVGKTTTAVNIAASLVHYEKKVLLIDLDSQGNASMSSGIEKDAIKATINEVLLEENSFNEACIKSKAGYDLLPSNQDLTVAEVMLLKRQNYQKRLSEVLAPVKSHYDYIIIDCPPALNSLTLNALVAANSVIITMQCEYFALEGLTALLGTIEQLCETINPTLHLEGILRTMFDPRTRLTLDVSEQLIKHFGHQVYDTVIPRNIRLAEAPSHGLPVLLYDKNSPGARAYLLLVGEMLAREQTRKEQAKKLVTKAPEKITVEESV